MPGIRAATVLPEVGGMAAILATGCTPAFAPGTTLHWLRLGNCVPTPDASDLAEATRRKLVTVCSA